MHNSTNCISHTIKAASHNHTGVLTLLPSAHRQKLNIFCQLSKGTNKELLTSMVYQWMCAFDQEFYPVEH